jgi:hypothetical protein
MDYDTEMELTLMPLEPQSENGTLTAETATNKANRTSKTRDMRGVDCDKTFGVNEVWCEYSREELEEAARRLMDSEDAISLLDII